MTTLRAQFDGPGPIVSLPDIASVCPESMCAKNQGNGLAWQEAQ